MDFIPTTKNKISFFIPCVKHGFLMFFMPVFDTKFELGKGEKMHGLVWFALGGIVALLLEHEAEIRKKLEGWRIKRLVRNSVEIDKRWIKK